MLDPVALVVAVPVFEPGITDPDALLARSQAPHGWPDALVATGAAHVNVVRRFGRDAVLRRGDVHYHFVADGAPPFPAPLFSGAKLVHTVCRLAADVVHVDGLSFPLAVRRLRMALPARTAIVVQDHGGFDPLSPVFRSRPRRLFYRVGLQAVDGFLFTAYEQAVPWQEAAILDRSQIIYEVPESSTALHMSSPTETIRLPGRPSLLWVGRLDSNKDPLTVVDGFERALGALPDAALTMVYADHPLLPEVTARIARSPALRTHVHLRGRLEHRALASLYRGADAFVLGSHREGSGFALIEALSFGLTPIVTDIPTLRRLSDGGRLGALFPPGDADGLARALTRLGALDLEARRAAIRAYFERELSWSVVGGSAVEIYRAVARTRQRSRQQW